MKRKVDWKWLNVFLAGMVLIFTLFPNSPKAAAAEYRYTYSDSKGSVSLTGSRHKISGTHMVWIDKDDAGKIQVFYRQAGSSEVKQITSHDGLKEAPVVSEDRFGNVRIVWEDQRAGTTGSNWDIYAFDLGSNTEQKLNSAAGQHGHISMDGHLVVWVESASSEMYLHDFQTGQTVAIGKGHFPAVSNEKIVYMSPTDGGLFLYSVVSGKTERILELPYHQYVDWFSFKGQWVVWKQRNLDMQSHYAMMNLDTNPGVAVNLTTPSVKAQEHSAIYIGDGQAAWLEYRGSAVQIVGADLTTGLTHQVTNGNRDQQLLGFQGNQILMTDEQNQLVYRTVHRTVITPSSGTVIQKGQVMGPAGGVIEADGAKLVIAEGTFEQNSRVILEPVDLDSLNAKRPASLMRELSTGWQVESDQSFLLPAILSVSYNESGLTPDQIRKIGLYRYDADSSSWTFAGGLADAANAQLNASIGEPGIYAVMIYEPAFQDLQGHWSKHTVEVLAARWLVSGMGGNRFEPNGKLTRAQFVKLLVDAFGLEVKPTYQRTFTDVSADFWGHAWIEAAAKAGWVAGYEGKFRPNDHLTREQMMTMIVQAMNGTDEALALSDADMERILQHADAGTIADWAKPYAAWVVKEGIMQGSGGMLFPKNTSSRAEGATVIYNLLIKKGDL